MSDFFDSTDFFSGPVDIPAEQLADISTPAIDPYGLDAGFPTLGTDNVSLVQDNPYGLDAGFVGNDNVNLNTEFAGNIGSDANINQYFYDPNLGSGSSVYNVDFSLNDTLKNVDFSADKLADLSSVTSGLSGSGLSSLNIGGLISGASSGNIGGLLSGISGAAGLGNITSSISSVNSVLANLSKLSSGGGTLSDITGLISKVGGLASSVTGGNVGGTNISGILSGVNGIISGISGGAGGGVNINSILSGVSGLVSGISGGQTQFDSQGMATGGSDKPNINKDTMALTQIGVYTNPGFFGDQSMKNSNVAFNNVVNLLSAVSGIASMLRTNPSPPPTYVRTPTNYILTDREKQSIESKSLALSSYGVVPQDILSAFFYILSALENPADLLYVAQVTGIPELGDIRYVRNIYGILSIKDIYKVGYLANGVASVINKYSTIFAASAAAANPNLTTFGDVEQARNISLALGIIGPLMLSSANSLSGNVGILANAPNISSSNIDRVVNSTINMAAGQTINLIGTALTNPSADIGQMASQIGIGAIKNVLNSTPLGGVLSAFGIFGGIAGGPLLSQMGGYAIGNFMSELITGKRIPTQKIANNPSLRPPSYQGKAFFGETPVSLPAVDQLFCRKVGSFGEPTGGSGTDSFGMQNFASFGGIMDVASVVTKMITGSSKTPDINTYYGQSVNTVVSNVANILNVKDVASIEMRRSDNAIPMMIGLSAAIAGQAFSPFGSKTMSDGWKLASSTANDIQNINPEYLQACATSL